MAHASVQARVAVDILLGRGGKGPSAVHFPVETPYPASRDQFAMWGLFRSGKPPHPLLFDILEAANRIPMDGRRLYSSIPTWTSSPSRISMMPSGRVPAQGIDAVLQSHPPHGVFRGGRYAVFPPFFSPEVGKAHPGTDCLVFKTPPLQEICPFPHLFGRV